MRAVMNHRSRPAAVVLTMTLEEFREMVEWLEELSPHDGCTKDWRAALDQVDPPLESIVPESWKGPKRG